MTEQSSENIMLVADIGGTNARFALHSDDDFTPRNIINLKVDAYPTIDDAIFDYLAQTGLSAVPQEVCLAMACPVSHDQIGLTNNAWSFSKSALRDHLNVSRLEVINDYSALAYAIPHLKADELHEVGQGKALSGHPLALLGPGTGLGVGGLVAFEAQPVALVTEGGHVEFAPTNELEMDILRFLWRTHEHVSVERLLSGMGLINLHQALAAIRDVKVEKLEPAQISQAALEENDPLAKEVLNVFCAILGSVAGNVALTLGALGGVYITGGIIPRMLDFFVESEFRKRFEAKGRFASYMAVIPTYVVTAQQPGLIGAYAALVDHR
jgi:glucokinase